MKTSSKLCGIYCIKCTVTNKQYIGSSINIQHRIKEHFYKLRNNKHHSQYLQRAYNKYPQESFNWEVLELCDRDDRLLIEQRYIDECSPEYNVSKVANCPMEGRKHSDETKLKFKNRKNHLKGELSPNYGKKWSDELRYKIMKSRIGRRHTEETKKKTRDTSIRLNRCKDLLKYIEAGKRKIIDNYGTIYESLTEASSILGISIQAICDNLKGRSKSTRKGYTFKYLEEK